ncbi:urea carboxylase-associated family protein [Rhizobium bangladeshense]|nr:urea carboxylase-associated family protein [Rhizobium bangladeshense]
MTGSSETVPASHGRGYQMQAGQVAIITNLHGNQVVDAWALAAAEAGEFSSMDHTRSVNSSIYFEKGMVVVSNRRRLMMTLVDDSAALRHDTLLCPCNAELYQQLGRNGYHRSCSDNFHEALSARAADLPFTPASLNLFMNVRVHSDGTLERHAPASKAGDFVALRAEMDLVLVLSACPQDITVINGDDRTPRDVAIRIVADYPEASS